ncbi:MAG: TIGR03767 family metallophosphoesterase [Actinobacteria bacterium]|nr:TIGR03767 family metallophosphoesterase [Actinomycetota bacterium]
MARRITRRGFLAGSAGVAAAGTVGHWLPSSPAQALDRSWRTSLAPQGTTLTGTIVPVGRGPYRRLAEGPGEPTSVRVDLAVPKAGREDRRVALASIVHFTDQHLTDAQSPGRVEFLDRVDPLFGAAFRPQELLTTHVATSMVEQVNRLGRGPITGRAFDATVCTGDNVDNQQLNELRWLVTILDGGLLTPDSGRLGAYEGAQDGVTRSTRWWHPEPGIDDDYKADLGYPDVPGLLERSLVPFRSPGLHVPWYSVYGNHDCNVQGNAARSDALDAVFTGDRKMTALPAGVGGIEFVLKVMFDSEGILRDLRSGAIPSRPVSPDPDRRTATVDDWLDAHLHSATGSHGYDADDATEGRLYYEFELAPGVVGIGLDTTNHAGGPNGAGGSLGAGQLAWLEERLAAHHERHLAPDGSVVRSNGHDRLVVLFSHHTSGTMDATDPDQAHPGERRILGAEVVATVLRYPNVVAWVNGHTHTNELAAHRRPDGHTSGFWEITTASHVDWPQQARVVEIADNRDGTISIFGTMIEHAAPAAVDLGAADVIGLAGLARELGANDGSVDPVAKAGDLLARNVELVLPAPFADPTAVTASTTSMPTETSPPSGASGTEAPPALAVGGVPAYTG